ncbi:YgaP family membrane protein [Dyella humicola]|uniref:YgaP family membrane protein n=1 Tax=Dyella humicola TaxID=2992126 RepID=UPI003CE58373
MRTAFFVKNIPSGERITRVVLAAIAAMLGIVMISHPWNWVVALACVGFGFTGVVGFCPACALAGRRLARNSELRYWR